jgi:tetratricopeptide (TPR) repeat protein
MSYSLGIAALEVRQRAVELADPAVRSTAEGLIAEGHTAFRAGNYDEALRRFTDAWTILPAPDTLLVIGLAMLRLGRFRDASYRFQRYLRENPDGDRREQAQELLAQAQVGMERSGNAPQTSDMDFVAEGYVPPERVAAPPPPPEVPADVMAAARASTQTAQQVQQRAPMPDSIPNPYRARTATYIIWAGTGAAVLGLGFVGYYYWKRSKAQRAAVKRNRRRRRRRTSRRR